MNHDEFTSSGWDKDRIDDLFAMGAPDASISGQTDDSMMGDDLKPSAVTDSEWIRELCRPVGTSPDFVGPVMRQLSMSGLGRKIAARRRTAAWQRQMMVAAMLGLGLSVGVWLRASSHLGVEWGRSAERTAIPASPLHSVIDSLGTDVAPLQEAGGRMVNAVHGVVSMVEVPASSSTPAETTEPQPLEIRADLTLPVMPTVAPKATLAPPSPHRVPQKLRFWLQPQPQQAPDLPVEEVDDSPLPPPLEEDGEAPAIGPMNFV